MKFVEGGKNCVFVFFFVGFYEANKSQQPSHQTRNMALLYIIVFSCSILCFSYFIWSVATMLNRGCEFTCPTVVQSSCVSSVATKFLVFGISSGLRSQSIFYRLWLRLCIRLRLLYCKKLQSKQIY